MRNIVIRSVVLSALCLGVLPAMAQKLTIESQGEAEIVARAQALNASAIAKAIGEAPAGKGQVVFFRAATSPGAGIGVEEGDSALIELDPGMYFVIQADPGTHGFDAGDAGNLDVPVAAGQTQYVQVIRNRAGQPRLLKSSAAKFQRAAH